MLQVKNLSVGVGGVTLVQGVSFNVRAREKVGVVGRNGAGKTSLLKVLGGAERQTKGLVQVKGGVGYLPQDPRLDGVPDDTMTLSHVLSGRGVADVIVRMEKALLAMEEDPSDRNIAAFSQIEEEFRVVGGYSAESEARRLAAGLGVRDDILDQPLAALSGGQRRRVAIARAMAARPKLLLYDEPTTGLDPMTSLTVDAEIIKLRDLEQVTSVLVTHQLRDAFYVATQQARRSANGTVEIGPAARDKIEQADFVMIKEGRVHFEGTAEELRHSKDPYLQTFLS